MEIIEILKNCTIANGNIIKLPDVQLERADYMKVKKLFESNGGKWKGGKCHGFLFNTTDVSPILSRLQGGDLTDRKKEFQFFATPQNIAMRLAVRLGDVSVSDRILEPSAGTGSLVKAVLEEWPDCTVDCYELMPENRVELEKITNARVLGDDFLTAEVGMYDKIIANPPFSKNQDIKHVMKMWDHLAENGQMAVRVIELFGHGGSPFQKKSRFPGSFAFFQYRTLTRSTSDMARIWEAISSPILSPRSTMV